MSFDRSAAEDGEHSSFFSRRAALGRVMAAGAAAGLAGVGIDGRSILAETEQPLTRPYAARTLQPRSLPRMGNAANASVSIVMVHGAFADASTWSGVSARLLPAGHRVMATANPLRDLAPDSAYLASLLNQIPGPVLLVGHSYAGCVIGEAAARVKNVVGLVFVSAVILEEGESQMSLLGQYPKSAPRFGPSLRNMTYPLPDSKEGEVLVVDATTFPEIFCADLAPALQSVLAVSQRPLAAAAATEQATAAAWKTLPSWAAFGTADMCLGAEALGAMADRGRDHRVKQGHGKTRSERHCEYV